MHTTCPTLEITPSAFSETQSAIETFAIVSTLASSLYISDTVLDIPTHNLATSDEIDSALYSDTPPTEKVANAEMRIFPTHESRSHFTRQDDLSDADNATISHYSGEFFRDINRPLDEDAQARKGRTIPAIFMPRRFATDDTTRNKIRLPHFLATRALILDRYWWLFLALIIAWFICAHYISLFRGRDFRSDSSDFPLLHRKIARPIDSLVFRNSRHLANIVTKISTTIFTPFSYTIPKYSLQRFRISHHLFRINKIVLSIIYKVRIVAWNSSGPRWSRFKSYILSFDRAIFLCCLGHVPTFSYSAIYCATVETHISLRKSATLPSMAMLWISYSIPTVCDEVFLTSYFWKVRKKTIQRTTPESIAITEDHQDFSREFLHPKLIFQSVIHLFSTSLTLTSAHCSNILKSRAINVAICAILFDFSATSHPLFSYSS